MPPTDDWHDYWYDAEGKPYATVKANDDGTITVTIEAHIAKMEGTDA